MTQPLQFSGYNVISLPVQHFGNRGRPSRGLAILFTAQLTSELISMADSHYMVQMVKLIYQSYVILIFNVFIPSIQTNALTQKDAS